MNLLKKSILSVVLSGLFVFVFVSFVSAYGTSPGPAGAPICNSTAPKAPWPTSVKIVGSGAVEVTWGKVDNASSWTVAYGVKSGKYIYGLHNFGNGESRSVKIGSLPRGTYYFVVRANNGCAPGPFSAESRIAVGGGTTTALITSTPTATNTTKVTATPTPKPNYVPGKVATPTPKGIVVPTATPKPANVGFWKSIINFFANLFGK